MTDADRLRAELERLNLSQRGLARALDLDDRLVRRWCAGKEPVPAIIWLALPSVAPAPTGRDP